MTLPSQQRSNREKLGCDCDGTEHTVSHSMELLDTLTEETWKAAQEEVLERVRAKVERDRDELRARVGHTPEGGGAVVAFTGLLAALKELTNQPACTCASFFTVRGTHKLDCPAFTNNQPPV